MTLGTSTPSIRHFHVVVAQRRQGNAQKRVMDVQVRCFTNLNLLFLFLPLSLPSPSRRMSIGNLSTRRFLRGDGNRKSNLLPIHVSRRQSRPSRLCADFVLLILTSPVKREFCFYDFRAFISFCLRCFALSDT